MCVFGDKMRPGIVDRLVGSTCPGTARDMKQRAASPLQIGETAVNAAPSARTPPWSPIPDPCPGMATQKIGQHVPHVMRVKEGHLNPGKGGNQGESGAF